MSENQEKHQGNNDQVDWKWEYLKLTQRIEDLLGMVNELKMADRRLGARISRLQREVKGYPDDDDERHDIASGMLQGPREPIPRIDIFKASPEELQEYLNTITNK